MATPIRILSMTLLLSLPSGNAGDFLSGLKISIPQNVAAVVPKQLEAVKQEVARNIAADSVKDLKQGVSNLKDTVASVKPNISSVAGDLKGAAEQTVQGAMETIDNTNDDKLAQDVASAASQAAEQLSASSVDISSALHDTAPQVASAVNKTGLKVADQLDSGEGVAVASGKPSPSPSSEGSSLDTAEVPEDGATQSSGGSNLTMIIGVLLLALMAGAGYLVFQRVNGGGQAKPLLLSEALQDVNTGRSAREPAIRMEAGGSTFQKF